MKTIKIILRAIVCCLAFLCAQDSAAQSVAVEQSIEDQVYIYGGRSIQNKKNHLIPENHCTYGVGEIEPYKKIFEKVFSAERKKELNGKRFSLLFYCDSSGNVLEVYFHFLEDIMITLEEVYRIEKLFLDYKFEIRNASCPNQKYYMVSIVYR